MSKPITVADLEDQTGTSGRSILYCECCGSECSANAGDYFMHSGDYMFECCELPMKLVRKSVVYNEVEL